MNNKIKHGLLWGTVLVASMIAGCKENHPFKTTEPEQVTKQKSTIEKNSKPIVASVELNSDLIKVDKVKHAPTTSVEPVKVNPSKIKTAPEVAKAQTDPKSKESEKPAVKTKTVKIPKGKVVKAESVARYPAVEFENRTLDFGEITEGDVIEHKFVFTNTGKAPLSLTNATATCGCATPSIPFLDIAPGEQGFVGVSYNSVNKDGDQAPEITITTNAYPKVYTLYLKGTVMPKEENEEDDEMVKDSLKR